jgi:hypothetical protein
MPMRSLLAMNFQRFDKEGDLMCGISEIKTFNFRWQVNYLKKRVKFIYHGKNTQKFIKKN